MDWKPANSFFEISPLPRLSPFREGLNYFEDAYRSLSLLSSKGGKENTIGPFYFPKSIVLDSGDFEPHSIIICTGIRIMSSYKGCIQIFSEGGILVEKGAQLNYPSVLALVGNVNSDLVMEGGRMDGIIFSGNPDSKIFIDQDAVVLGEIYSLGGVDHRGRLFGSMFVKQPFYSGSSGLFQPYMVDGIIRPERLPEHYVFSFLYPQNGRSDVLAFL